MNVKYKSDFYKLNLNDKSYRLVYKIKKYEKVKNKYKLTEEKLVPLEQRIKIVTTILNTEYKSHKSLQYFIDKHWLKNGFKKLTTDKLSDQYSIILEIMATYILYEPKESEILSIKQLEDIALKECWSYDTENNSSQIDGTYENDIWHINKYSKSELENFQNTNKMLTKRWNKSNTYKHNKIYTYKSGKPYKYWNWLKNDWIEVAANIEWDRVGVIDQLRPYIVKWCYVNTNNEFIFNNVSYKISDLCDSYDGESDMILCFIQENNHYYFDMSMNSIELDFITEL